MVFTLAVICSVVAVAVIVSVTLLVFLLKRWKKKSRDKSGNCGFHDNTPQNSQEQNGTIYSAVVFKSHEDQVELYANLQTHRPRHTDPSSTGVIQTRECEYSTILTAHT
ncbi:uncharacterized protein [Misgurnus anguillicaudatus]|uniref:uncharacterized protein n=1 Tax=Misgurnus anguillicaudatus TaxID=75329 RepID=UPI003CCF358C